jgi:hypothetical protein
MPSMIGNAARKGQENGITATPKASVAAGVSSTQASAVSAAQVVVGGDRRQGGDLRRHRPGGRRYEREQATLGHGAADRDEDQSSVPKEPLGGKFRAHRCHPVRNTSQLAIRRNTPSEDRIPVSNHNPA